MVGSSSWRAQRVLVLCYHGVSFEDEHQWAPDLYMSQRCFADRLRVLREERCTVLSLDEALARSEAGDLPPRSVVLTFDDGTVDFAHLAVPALAREGMPATLYLTTYYSGRQTPVPTTSLSYLLWKARSRGTIDLDGAFGISGRRPVASAADRAIVIREAMPWFREATAQSKDESVSSLAMKAGYAPGEFLESRKLQIMNAAEVSALPSGMVNVELHTHRHRASSDPDKFALELEENFRIIAALRGTRPRHFCYPSGIYRSSMFDVLRQFGVASATTCDPGLLTADTDPLLIPRLVDSLTMSEEVFRAWVNGTAHWLPRSRRAGEPDQTYAA